MSKGNKIFVSICILISIILCLLISYFYLSNNLKYYYTNKDYELLNYIDYIDIDISKEKAKEIIDKKFNNIPYFYNEVNYLEENKLGNCNPFIRIINIVNYIDIYKYIITLIHELVHINNLTNNEIFVNYTTFILLYESEIEEFVYCSKILAQSEMNYNNYDDSCWYYIKKYLE